jgi:hypothetical protein
MGVAREQSAVHALRLRFTDSKGEADQFHEN